MRKLIVFSERDKDMDVHTRHDVNFMMNLCRLYDVYGLEETERMLTELGTDVSRKLEN